MRVVWGVSAVLVLGGCGDVTRQPLDLSGAGATGGGAQSSTSGTGAAGPVLEVISVIDHYDELPVAGVPILLSDANGDVVDLLHTNDQGHVTVDVPEGGLVSAFHEEQAPCGSSGCSRSVTSLPGVEDGADLTLRMWRSEVQRPPLNEPMTIELLIDPAPARAVAFRIAFACADGTVVGYGFCDWDLAIASTTVHTIDDYRGCPGASTYDVYLFAESPDGVLAYAAVLDAPLNPGSVATHAVTWSSDAFVSTETTITAIPAGTVNGWASVWGRRSGGCRVALDWDDLATTGTRITLDHRAPPYFDELEHFESLDVPGSVGSHTRSHWMTWTTAPPPTTAWVVNEPAGFGELTLGKTEDGRPTFAWKLAPDGTLGDGLQITGEFTPGKTYWSILTAPVHAGVVQFPRLPRELSAYAPENRDPDTTLEGYHAIVPEGDGFPDWLRRRRGRLETFTASVSVD